MKALDLHGTVGMEITHARVSANLKAAGGAPVQLRIDSPGGAAESAVPIYHAIRDYAGETSAFITRAASGAFLIALAADHRVIARDGWMMTHRARQVSVGVLSDHQATVEGLRAIDDRLRTLITERTGIADLDALDEQWLSAEACLRLGLAHRIGAPCNRPWRPPADAWELKAREALALLDGATEALTMQTERMQIAAAERVAAATLDPAFEAALPPTPPPLGIGDDVALDELRRIVAGQNEVRRRRAEILEHASFRARAVAAALTAGVAIPAEQPPHWHCALCGEPNFHSPGAGTEPTPCATCRGAIRGHQPGMCPTGEQT